MKPTLWNKAHTNNHCQQSGRSHRLEELLHHVLVMSCYEGPYHQNLLSSLFLRVSNTLLFQLKSTMVLKDHSVYCSKMGFVVCTCGLVINPSLPWLGASPDGLVEDPSEKCVGLLQIKCPFTYCFSTVEEACIDPSFLQPSQMTKSL